MPPESARLRRRLARNWRALPRPDTRLVERFRLLSVNTTLTAQEFQNVINGAESIHIEVMTEDGADGWNVVLAVDRFRVHFTAGDSDVRKALSEGNLEGPFAFLEEPV
jgi:hypothetical protein